MLSRMKRKTMDPDGSRSCLGETSHRASEATGNDLILEPKHKIFLSHSGAQKDFVDHLCKAFEDQCHYPFFDRRHESLPKGEQFPELIVRAAQQCEMLIVVLSDKYFMSKWPMIELSAFVQAHKLHHDSKSSTKGPMIFPLFYGLSVDDLKNPTMQEKWFQKWKTLAKADSKNRIIVDDWKYALDVLSSFDGLSYDANLKESVTYVEQIVSCVCKSIPPEKRWDDSHIQGKSKIWKVIAEKIEGIGVCGQKKGKVVGLYGVGGIGKTTTCKILCNELLSKYEGRVCHIEFPSQLPSDSKEFFQKNSNKFFQKVLRDLTSKHVDVIQCLEEGQCMEKLRTSLSERRTFLAIDNVSDSYESIDLAKTILGLGYHEESLVVVTARSQKVLRLLGIDGDACLEMPDLGEADAMRLFWQHAVGGQEFPKDEEKRDIMTCVRSCYFSKGGGQDCHFHPLALRALGLQLGCLGRDPSLWVEHLRRVRNFNSLSGENPVFGILRSGFDLLVQDDQILFMDLGFFLTWNAGTGHVDIELFYSLHKQEEELRDGLERLKRKGLLEDVDLRSGKVTMHDLYWEFAKLEAKGFFSNSTSLEERMWLYIENGDLTKLKRKVEGGFWYKLRRLTVYLWCFYDDYGKRCDCPSGSLKGINWDYFSNVEVLHLFDVVCGRGSLNLKGLVCLRILELFCVKGIDGIEGLGELENLTHIAWTLDNSDALPNADGHFVGGLPISLKELRIASIDEIEECGVVLGSDLFTQCHNLLKLCLNGVEACSLDLSKCKSLESLSLSGILKLQSVLGLTPRQSSKLQSLEVEFCYDLVDIPGINHLLGLKKLRICSCPEYQESILLTNSIPCHLQEFGWTWSQLSNGLNLPRFNQLEVLDLGWSKELTSLAELGDLPALQRLDLHDCEQLKRLPNLSKSSNLKELKLTGCYTLQLHEKDIQMLCELPLLEPLPFTLRTKDQSLRLDLRGWKVLVHQSINSWATRSWELWRAGEWEERALGPPPIGIGESGPFSIGTECGMD